MIRGLLRLQVLPPSEELDIRSLEQTLYAKNLTNSYKLFWFSALLTEISMGRSNIGFREIIARMLAKAWYPIIRFKLFFGPIDKISDAVSYLKTHYDFPVDIQESELTKQILQLVQRDDRLRKRLEEFTKYVPYRFLSPFFSSGLRGLLDAKKNEKIELLSSESSTAIYQIVGDAINLPPAWFRYLSINQGILRGWCDYHLIMYLQQRNPNVPAIAAKLTAPQTRDLRIAKSFWHEIIQTQQVNDIYTKADFKEISFDEYGSISIDHFLPWSFVLHDQIWNLTPTFQSINSAKNDRLPNLELHFEDFCQLQYTAYSFAQSIGKHKKLLEDYYRLDARLASFSTHRDIIEPEIFNRILKNAIVPLHQIAYNQGFNLWQWNN